VTPHPLAGRRIAITRGAGQTDALAEGIRALGGEAVVHPAIAICPPDDERALDDAVARLHTYAWVVVTSANAARALGERFSTRAPDAVLGDARIAAIGPATAAALTRHVRAPDLVAPEHVGASLGATIPVTPGDRVLFPRAELARETLPFLLRGRGASVDEVVAYRTVPGPGLDALCAELRACSVDAALFASASAVRFTAEALKRSAHGHPEGADPDPLEDQRRRVAVFCLGPSTAAEARACGFMVDGIAEPHTTGGLLHVVARWFELHGRHHDD